MIYIKAENTSILVDEAYIPEGRIDLVVDKDAYPGTFAAHVKKVK